MAVETLTSWDRFGIPSTSRWTGAAIIVQFPRRQIVTPRTGIGQSMGAFAAFTDPVGNEFGLYEEPKQ